MTKIFNLADHPMEIQLYLRLTPRHDYSNPQQHDSKLQIHITGHCSGKETI